MERPVEPNATTMTMTMSSSSSSSCATMRPASGGKSFVTLSTYKERQEALKRTTIMEDDVNHRKSRIFTTEPNRNCNEQQQQQQQQLNGNIEVATQNGHQVHIAPPPPQFANSPPKSNQQMESGNGYKTAPQNCIIRPAANALPNAYERKPPSSPVPDYDNVQLRAVTSAVTNSNGNGNGSGNGNGNCSSYSNMNAVTNGREPNSVNFTGIGNRHTMRLGTVTIGEYEQFQRKEPAKFDFIGAQKRHNAHNLNGNQSNVEPESLRTELQNTLSRSNLKKTNGHLTHQTNCPLRNGSNIESVTRKLQNASIGGNTATAGILKNGNNRNSGSNFSKSTEKSIKFDN